MVGVRLIVIVISLFFWCLVGGGVRWMLGSWIIESCFRV